MEILLSVRSKFDGSVREVKREIGNGLVLGRGAEQGVLLEGPDLSREHVVITTNGESIYVTDLSSNGTWLNGTRLKRSVRNAVRSEDVIEVPGYLLRATAVRQSEISADAPEAREDGEAVAVLSPAVEIPTLFPPQEPEPAAPRGIMRPVLDFVGSFTFTEKVIVLVSFCGLLLLYAYVGGS